MFATTEREASATFPPPGLGALLGKMRGAGLALRSSPSLDTLTVEYEMPIALDTRITPWWGSGGAGGRVLVEVGIGGGEGVGYEWGGGEGKGTGASEGGGEEGGRGWGWQ